MDKQMEQDDELVLMESDDEGAGRKTPRKKEKKGKEAMASDKDEKLSTPPHRPVTPSRRGKSPKRETLSKDTLNEVVLHSELGEFSLQQCLKLMLVRLFRRLAHHREVHAAFEGPKPVPSRPAGR